MTAVDVIFIDDDPQVLEAYSETLELEQFKVASSRDAAGALAGITGESASVVLTDVRMPSRDGFDVLELVKTIDKEIPVVLITGHGDVPMALRALRAGAWDFLEKPADPVLLVETIRRGLNHRRLVLENRRLRVAIDGQGDWERRIIGHADATMAMRRALMRLADLDTDVLIVGETGTGKEVAARALHDFGARAKHPFVAVNCGAIPETMLETELFGHEPGAFTGARDRRIGKIEYANRGTLFLDEIESMTAAAQVRLLRVLQERKLERLGSNKEIPVDLRVVTATKTPLADLVRQGRFREDLSYRLDVARVVLPPLRERHGDIALLFRHFVDQAARRYDRPVRDIDARTLQQLGQKEWPGNIRELRNAAERYALAIDDVADPAPATPFAPTGGSLEEQMDAHEASIIASTLASFGGRIGETAGALGISRKTLYLKMKKLGLSQEAAASPGP
ncbi:sigma-54-dependent transcriptional regulator [Mesorhizobium marinum]|uniref:sigma-54-dependent transcriptional regulator n=1 Tax=Mesorhizobium marinum TaxID=3228790 RepID=UPI0034653EEC